MKLPSSCVQNISCQPRGPFESGLHGSPLVASNCMANVSDVALRRGPSAPFSAEGCHSHSTRPLAASMINPPPPTSKSPGLSFVAGLAEANFCTTTDGANACHSRRADCRSCPKVTSPAVSPSHTRRQPQPGGFLEDAAGACHSPSFTAQGCHADLNPTDTRTVRWGVYPSILDGSRCFPGWFVAGRSWRHHPSAGWLTLEETIGERAIELRGSTAFGLACS